VSGRRGKTNGKAGTKRGKRPMPWEIVRSGAGREWKFTDGYVLRWGTTYAVSEEYATLAEADAARERHGFAEAGNLSSSEIRGALADMRLDAAREAREARLVALGYELPSEEQRAQNVREITDHLLHGSGKTRG